MAIDPNSRQRFNLSKTEVLLLDPSPIGLDILFQILSGLGARRLHRCETVEQAKVAASGGQIDLMIVDAISESGEGYGFVRWLRRETAPPNRHAPVLLTTGHTRLSDVTSARDCGSHYILVKPLAPAVLVERINWIVRRGRPFVVSDAYVGPDRRVGRKNGRTDHPLRRHDDASLKADTPAAAPDQPLEQAS